ncbi:MAG: TetR/AcrR family transcriptional regulator [Acidimicrobiia bacterium]|nr:TetR/AcrR family transcriptional regulator [Acidimicrobiia bacterium]
MSPTTRARARKGEGDQLRRDILAAAEELLTVEGSADAVSVRAIAEQVGVTSPAIYMHWKHKDDIFTEVCSIRFAEFSSRVMANVQGEGPVLDRLAEVARAYMAFAEEHPEQYRVLFMQPVSAVPDGAPPTAGAMAFQMVVGVLEAAVAEQEMRELDPVTTAAALFAAIHGAASLVVDRHEDIPVPEPAALVEAVIDVSFHGIAAGPAKP